MTIAEIRDRWTRQPSGYLAVEDADPLVESLAFLWIASQPFQLVVPSAPLTVNPATGGGQRNARGGIGWTAAGSEIGSLRNSSIRPILTQNGAGTGDYTTCAYVEPVAAASNSWVFMQTTNAASAYTGLCANLNSSVAAASGWLAFIEYDGSAFSLTAAASVVDSEPHMYVGVRRGTTYELWVDGRLASSATQTVRNFLAGSTQDFRFGSDPGAARPTNYPIYTSAGWNRALHPGEIPRTDTDLYRLIRKRMGVPIIVPSGPTVTALTPTTIGSTTARVRYSITY